MNKIEFIEGLRNSLEPEVSADVVRDNVEYYSRYIYDEIQKGRSEEEVVEELGDPWVIARTIIDMNEGENVEDVVYDSADTGEKSYKKELKFKTWKWGNRLIDLIITVMIIAIIFVAMAGLLRVVLPILVPVVLAMMIYRVIRNIMS